MMPEELTELAHKEQTDAQQWQHQIHVCTATGCLSAQSDQVYTALTREVRDRGMDKTCRVKGVGCLGLCSAGPLVQVNPAGTLYQHVQVDDVPELVQSLKHSPVERLVCSTDIPFFQQQVKIVLANAGNIDPERIEEYLAVDGYQGLLQAVTEMTPSEVISEVIHSGLRGRGGAGYPTGLKWTTVAKADSHQKYVICNADEGDPGAFMDRNILESDPHCIIEGMAIAGYAVGATQGYIYVRSEYPLAIKRLRNALRRAERLGVIGNNIFESAFRFQIDVRLGAGAFVCGEETALIASIEGRRGNPRPRPPYPAEAGLWGQPTLINNVETLANIPAILRNGGGWFATIGSSQSTGTKVFALTGKVNHGGLIEVPMGMSLRSIVFDIGGGIPNELAFKAMQTGGPSGGCIPETHLDMPTEYETLNQIGSIMGSGGIIIMDETSSMVDVARFYMEFCQDESCGKCVPCRVGTAQLATLLTKIAEGMATPEDLILLEELCDVVKHTSLCGLGQSAPNPVLSTLRFFRHEYLAHIRQ
ncbi:MAG: NADH-quinone oxidoreductase subunit L [Chloroflexaceae bacterium]|nr:NADH-quinone oxidoreductase subunit L [Chloroflexaceae bacterium]